MTPRASVVVATYERPEYLELCLWSLAVQSARDFEIVVADDGSGDATAAVVTEFSRAALVPVQHAWQPHEGFRKAAAVNEAVGLSRSEHLIFTDGDCIAHPRFVEQHVRLAAAGTFLVGRTPRLGPELSSRVSVAAVRTRRAQRLDWEKVLDGLRGRSRKVEFGLYLGGGAVYRGVRRWKRNLELWGGNFSCWRKDFEAVNGFNEEFVGWGKEDLDLGVRLLNYGLRPVSVTHAAVNFHLWHGAAEDKKANVAWQTALKARYKESGEHRCPRGLDGHRRARAD